MAELNKKAFDIYEEGFRTNGESAYAHYLGVGYGESFIEACKEFIARTKYGKIYIDDTTGEEYACDWGCRWFPTLEEAQKNFG